MPFTFLKYTIFILVLINTLAAQINPYEKYYKAVEYRGIGPNRGGRSCAVTGVINQNGLYYFGSTGGGVWKSENSGITWTNISDGFFGGSIGAISVSDADPNIIYVGTGEETVRGNVSSGHGMWKSEDAGKTWINIGLIETRHIAKIKIHPKDASIVFVAALGDIFKSNSDRGIYKSMDGGLHWKKVLFISDSVGANDLAFDPVNPKIMYATTWRVSRSAYELSSGGKGSGIWKSIDGGETWKDLSKAKNYPSGLIGKCNIAVCPSKRDRIYAMVENLNGGLFRSDDSGDTWEKLNDSRNLRQRAWYFNRVYADPKDANVVYVLNVEFHKSTDGGKTFRTINTSHGDYHDLWVDPVNPNRMIVGHDGGAQVSDNSGNSWSSLRNQNTAQFYRVTVDNAFPYRIYAAQQDNSTIRIKHRSESFSIGESDWESTAGGESGHIAVDPLNNDIVYGGSYGGYLTMYDHANKISRSVNVWPDNPIGHGAENLKYRFQWNFPIFFSPHNPKKIYAASNHLHCSYDGGNSWLEISPDLTRNDSTKLKASGGPITKDNTSVEYYCTIFAVAESPIEKNVIWTGSDDGLIHLTKDGGINWSNVTPANLPQWTMINCIEPDPYSAATCFVAATSYKSGDRKPYIYKTEDYGKTWAKIVNGIQSEHFTRAVRADRSLSGLLYAGTEEGMYISFNKGMNWYPFQLNLPTVPVTDICLKNEQLIISTQGRGLWIIDDLNPIRSAKSLSAKNYLVTPKPVIRAYGPSYDKPSTKNNNHPNAIMLYTYIDSIAQNDSAQIVLINDMRDTVCQYSTKTGKNINKLELISGSNLTYMNYNYPAAKSFDDMILWWSSLNGPVAFPGKYKILTNIKGQIDSVDCIIEKDPRYPVTDADVKKQFEFIKNCRDKIDESHRCIIQMRDVRAQMNDYLARIEKNEKSDTLFKTQKQIDSLFTQIENELYQTKNKSGQDPINYPIKLTNKLAHLISLYGNDSYPPTVQAESFRKEISSQIDEQIQKFESVKTNELKTFNILIRNLEIDVIRPKKIE